MSKSAGAFLLQLGFYQHTLTWAWQFMSHTQPISTAFPSTLGEIKCSLLKFHINTFVIQLTDFYFFVLC